MYFGLDLRICTEMMSIDRLFNHHSAFYEKLYYEKLYIKT